MLEALLAFMHERQRIHLKRKSGEPFSLEQRSHSAGLPIRECLPRTGQRDSLDSRKLARAIRKTSESVVRDVSGARNQLEPDAAGNRIPGDVEAKTRPWRIGESTRSRRKDSYECLSTAAM